MNLGRLEYVKALVENREIELCEIRDALSYLSLFLDVVTSQTVIQEEDVSGSADISTANWTHNDVIRYREVDKCLKEYLSTSETVIC